METERECTCSPHGHTVSMGEIIEVGGPDPHPNCPIHGEPTPESKADVVERLEYYLHLEEMGSTTGTDVPLRETHRDALTAIHDLTVEAESQKRWADEYKAERDKAREELDRVATENIEYTTRIGELEAENANLREDLDRMTQGTWSKSIAKQQGINANLRVENAKLRDLVGHCWVHSGYRRCGYNQMDTEQKALFDAITEALTGEQTDED